MTTSRHTSHLTTSQVAAILDRRLRPSERRETIAHLSTCLECRHEVAEMQHALKALGAEPRSGRRWSMVLAGAAAALVVAAVPLAMLSSHHGSGSTLVATRAGNVTPVDAIAAIDVVAPGEGAYLPARPELVWRPAGAGASYLVTLQDTSGAVLWSSSVTDTTARIPSSVRLIAGNRYFWSADARLPNGVSMTTGVHVFRVP